MYEAKKFDHLLGLSGLSDTLLTNHFTLYEGYVKNTNSLVDALKTKEVGTPEWAELHRRFGWEWNGMRLHELYFGNLTKEKTEPVGEMKKVIDYLWGSYDGWKKDFAAICSMRGIGWAVIALDKEKKMMFNTWINEHDMGHLAGATPLLVIDVFEHAYMTDYGIKRAGYVESILNAIDWNVVEERIQK